MIEIIASCVSTGAIIFGGFWTLLKICYISRSEFNEKLESFKTELKEEKQQEAVALNKTIEKFSDKLDSFGEKFVTISNFKIYSNSVDQLLKLYNDKTTRIETLMDNLSENVNEVLKKIKIN